MPKYNTNDDVIKSYHDLYKTVLYEDCDLLAISNDNYDVSTLDKQNVGLLLNLGHHFANKKNDIRQATYYYDKVKNLNSHLGMYSLAVFYYLNNLPGRAKMYATNAITLNDGCKKSTLLLYQIYMKEKKYNLAEICLSTEINRLTSKKLYKESFHMYERLCSLYFETKNNEKLYETCEIIEKFNNETAYVITCKYYLENNDFDKLEESSQMLMLINKQLGNYFIGMLNYKKMLVTIVSGNYDRNDMNKLIEVANTFFEIVISDEKSYTIAKIKAQKALEVLITFSNKLNNNK